MDFKEQEAYCSFYGQQAHVDKEARTQKEQREKLCSPGPGGLLQIKF